MLWGGTRPRDVRRCEVVDVSCHVWLVVWIALTLIFVGGALDYTHDYLGQVAPGMSQTQVLRAWGEPNHVLDTTYVQTCGGARIDLCTWVYDSPTRSVVFEGNKVAHCTERQNY